jgi:SAM-dependent methyltransferase
VNRATEMNVRFYDQFAPYYPAVYGFLDAEATVGQWVQLLDHEGLVPSEIDRLQRRPRLLDAGCGPGWFLAAWAQAGFEVAGVDASPSMLRLAQQEWRRRNPAIAPGLVQADLCDGHGLPIAPGTVDVVVCHSHLPNLIHPEDLPAFLRNLIDSLRPGGCLAFDHTRIVASTPNGSEEHPIGSGVALLRSSRYEPDRRRCVQRWQGDIFMGEETYWFHDTTELDTIAQYCGASLWKRMEWAPDQPHHPFVPETVRSERLVSLYRRR